MPKPQKRPKRHHVLPRFYLRPWADSNGRVAMTDRNGKQIRTGVNALAVEKDFYTFTDKYGNKNSDLESIFAGVDSKASSARNAFLEGRFPPDKDQRQTFAEWLALQVLRGRAARALSTEFYDRSNKLLIEMGLENANLPEDPHEREVNVDLGHDAIPIPDFRGLSIAEREQLAQTSEYEIVPDRGQLLLQMVQAVPAAATPFLDAEWQLFRFQKPLLHTSDEPIHIGRGYSPMNGFLGLGLSNADYLGISISPNLYLGMLATESFGQERIHDLTPSLADEFNSAALGTWWTQYFRHPEGSPFPTDIPDLPKKRIQVNPGSN